MDIQYIKNTNLAYCDGYKFRKDKKSGYWLCSTLHKRLHIYIYEKYNGKVPNGYEIHHKDRNKDNNEIENLQLVTKEEHRKIHNKLLDKEKLRQNLEKNARPKAIEWHKSEEGRKWHKEHYKNMENKLHIKKTFVCLNCKKEFISIQPNSKFCSNICKARWRRENHIDDEKRTCIVCGKEFMTNKYRKAQTCSKKCASVLRKKS